MRLLVRPGPTAARAGAGRWAPSFFAMLALAFALASCAAAVGGCCCLNLCDADAGDVEAASPRGVARPPPASDFDWHHKQSPR